MSGGSFDYMQYRIDDAVDQIEYKLKNNRKTIQEWWDSLDDDAKRSADDYERPWTPDRHPYWLDEEAQRKADDELGLRKGDWSKMSDVAKAKWNQIRRDYIRKEIEEHNNSFYGPDYSDEVVAKMTEMVKIIKMARIYLERIDWLFSGDDGEDSFLKRSEEEINEAGLGKQTLLPPP